MRPRRELQAILEAIAGKDRVYFQPPPKVTLSYPCIVYHRSDIDVRHASDKPYLKTKRYQVTVIDRDPDSRIPDDISELPMARFERGFTIENLNHSVFQIYF